MSGGRQCRRAGRGTGRGKGQDAQGAGHPGHVRIGRKSSGGTERGSWVAGRGEGRSSEVVVEGLGGSELAAAEKDLADVDLPSPLPALGRPRSRPPDTSTRPPAQPRRSLRPLRMLSGVSRVPIRPLLPAPLARRPRAPDPARRMASSSTSPPPYPRASHAAAPAAALEQQQAPEADAYEHLRMQIVIRRDLKTVRSSSVQQTTDRARTRADQAPRRPLSLARRTSSGPREPSSRRRATRRPPCCTNSARTLWSRSTSTGSSRCTRCAAPAAAQSPLRLAVPSFPPR